MTNAIRLVRLLCSIGIVQGLGCAADYDRYAGCQVDCRYCAPAPLPYTHYHGCVCHSTAASRYLAAAPTPLMRQPGEEANTPPNAVPYDETATGPAPSE